MRVACRGVTCGVVCRLALEEEHTLQVDNTVEYILQFVPVTIQLLHFNSHITAVHTYRYINLLDNFKTEICTSSMSRTGR